MNIPFGSTSDGNIFVIRPWRNFAASGPCSARSPRRGLRFTQPVFGMKGGSLLEAGKTVEFHRWQFKGGRRLETIPPSTRSGFITWEEHIRMDRTIRIVLGFFVRCRQPSQEKGSAVTEICEGTDPDPVP